MTQPGVGTGGHFNADRNNSLPGRNKCGRVKGSAVTGAGTRRNPDHNRDLNTFNNRQDRGNWELITSVSTDLYSLMRITM